MSGAVVRQQLSGENKCGSPMSNRIVRRKSSYYFIY
jgi:hypothetical protein